MQTYSQNLPLNELIGGRYRIQSVLGEGGFGVTYKAWDEKLKRQVVIKEYLPGELGVRDQASLTVLPRSNHEAEYRYGLQKYLEEAVTLARFNHPNIVQILDHLEANGTAYIVMKFEEGETLGERLKRDKTPWPEAALLDLINPILRGLQQVHESGLLHRDIKPGNIFLRKQGGPLLIDFGSARHALGEHSKSLSAIVSLGYAPPEQYSTRGKQGPYTDLYGLGAVLYELISGHVPADSNIRIHALSEDEPDPLPPAAKIGKDKYPPWLLDLIDHLLFIKTRDRPKNCQHVLLELEHILAKQNAEPCSQTISRTRVVSESERWVPSAPLQSTNTSEEEQSKNNTPLDYCELILAVGMAVGWVISETFIVTQSWISERPYNWFITMAFFTVAFGLASGFFMVFSSCEERIRPSWTWILRRLAIFSILWMTLFAFSVVLAFVTRFLDSILLHP